MKRKGALLIASNERNSFTLRFYPDREEPLGPESFTDREVRTAGELGLTLTAMGFSGVAAFLEHLGDPPEVLEFLEIQLTKAELRKFGLLGSEASPPPGPPSRSRPDEKEETGH